MCLAEVKADAAGLSTGGNSSTDMVPGSSELSVKDRETARRNFTRVNSMQREQLGLGGQPLPETPLPEGITPEQLFPGTYLLDPFFFLGLAPLLSFICLALRPSTCHVVPLWLCHYGCAPFLPSISCNASFSGSLFVLMFPTLLLFCRLAYTL